MIKWVMAAGMIAMAPMAASAQDAENGKDVFKKCQLCHQMGANTIGPDLKGVVGRKAGTVAGFVYSKAMLNSGLTWDEATLDAYIKKPSAKVPGNAMVFAGIEEDADRKDLIAFLATQK